MQMVLDPAQLIATREALNDTGSEALIELIFRLNLGRPADDVPAAALERARALGWVDSKLAKLTALGYLVADPIREYRFWMDRGRRLHSEHEYALLAKESYRGKRVLEIGCGFGCNLFSLAGMDGQFVGVEPVALYRQFTPLLAEREKIPAPEVVDGKGEALPFADGQFDIVLCYSAHQYMDIRPAILEMARVLKPGGQLQIVGGTIGPFSKYVFKFLFIPKKWGSLKSHGLSLCNTIAYCLSGSRLYTPGGAAATTAPIYPPVAFMHSLFRQSGLHVRADLFRRVSGEACFVAEKLAHRSAS